MIEGTIVKLGYGDIVIDYTYHGLRFREISKPQTVGFYAKDDLDEGKVKFTGARLLIEIRDTADLCRFSECLEAVKQGKTQIVWDTITLDFSNNNPLSIDVLEKTFESFRVCVLCPWAC